MNRALAAMLVASLAPFASAQPTAITYQGDLREGGTPANGLHDFRFRLFDAATGGATVGAQVCADNVAVDNGVFTTVIDFGQQFATAAGRFLEIEVRDDTGLSCSNAGGFVILSPRQRLTAAPFATHAGTASLAFAANAAFTLSAPDGSPAAAVFVDNAGKVGVGTTAPTHTVHVANAEPTLALQDTDSAGTSGGQQVGYISYRDSGNVERAWVGYGSPGDPDFSIVNARPGGDIVLNAFGGGRVGIGITAPTATLHVAGNATIGGPLSATALSVSPTLRACTIHPYDLRLKSLGAGATIRRDDDGGLQVFDDGVSEFVTCVHLPDGATVVMVETLGHDGATNPLGNITTTFGRTSFAGTALVMATTTSAAGGSVWNTTSISSPIVDNNTNSYWLRVGLGGGIPPFDCTLFAVRVLYRVSNPLP